MKTNNKEGFILATLSYLAVTFLDLYFTYLGTPNLALEGNPLYNVIFFDWKGLIILNAITLIIYVAIAIAVTIAVAVIIGIVIDKILKSRNKNQKEQGSYHKFLNKYYLCFLPLLQLKLKVRHQFYK